MSEAATRALPDKGSAKPIIEARGLVKTFRNGTLRALDGLDFSADPGDMIAIVGPSGSGKSTLLFALSGLIELDSGLVSIDGVAPVSAADWVRLRSHQLGLVFQDDWLLNRLTAAENVELPMIGVDPDARSRRARVRDLLVRVNAAAFANRLPASLSGGERQRVAIARSLANRPRVVLADEPTGELDRASSRSIIELLSTLCKTESLTVIVVTHEPDVAAACRRRFILEDGRGRYDQG